MKPKDRFAGHFEVAIRADRLRLQLKLEAHEDGNSAKHYQVVSNANQVVIPFSPRHSP